MAGFDETTLRFGPTGEKKYVHGAFTKLYLGILARARSLDSMEDAEILPEFAGIVVSDRYQNYFNPRWKHVAGNQASLAHILRDYEDCAESYPDAVWPVQAQRARRGMIHAWHAACEQGLSAIPANALKPLEHEFRHAVLAGRACPVCRARRTARSSRPAASCSNSAKSAATTCSASPGTPASADEQHQRARRPPAETQQKISGAWPATTSPKTGSTSEATSTPPASTAGTPWTSCTTSWSAGPGDPRTGILPVTAAETRTTHHHA